MQKFSLIVAHDSNYGISKDNAIPWIVKEDVHFFADITKREYIPGMQNIVIMGRKTWETAPKLKGRITIVLSSTVSESTNDLYFVSDLSECVNMCRSIPHGKAFVCGGHNVYKEFVNKDLVEEYYITEIENDYDCDNRLPQNVINIINCKCDRCVTKQELGKFVVLELGSQTYITITFYKIVSSVSSRRNEAEIQYTDLLKEIIANGHIRKTRNSMVRSIFGKTIEFDLKNGFPILTTKKVFFRGVFEELMFFLRGETDSKILSSKGVKIWEQNTSRQFLDSVGLTHYDEGAMGNLYGFTLRHYGAKYDPKLVLSQENGFDQVNYCLDVLKNDPYSRRIVMTTFNPKDVNDGPIWPCHGISIIFHVERGHRLSCMMTQRSVDVCCGLPFNIVQYALLIHLFCEVINNTPSYDGPEFSPGRLIMNLGDVHLYDAHCSGAIAQSLREPYDFPRLIFNKKVSDITQFAFEDLELVGYTFHPPIKYEMIA